ncbi:MAG: branched-chain amino acid ABC transporter permease [Ignavibacteria bacterium]|nr:branched-chain amino acid ABC transporter permease [Ignavibacteria bacterium]
MIASAVSGIAGALFATYYSYIDPTSFTLDESILIISIVLIGGLGSIAGQFQVRCLCCFSEALKFIDIPDSIAANVRMMIYSLTLILIVLFRPNGFFGKFKFE